MFVDEKFLAKIVNTFLYQNDLESVAIMSYIENEKYETRILTGNKMNTKVDKLNKAD